MAENVSPISRGPSCDTLCVALVGRTRIAGWTLWCGQSQLIVRIDFVLQSCPAGLGSSSRLADHSARLGAGASVCWLLLFASEHPPEI